MLSLRERVLLLFASAPDGFEATAVELARKFSVRRPQIDHVLMRLAARGVIAKASSSGRRTRYSQGQALKVELGSADA